MEKANQSPQDIEKIKALLSQDNANEFMSSEESEGQGTETGPAEAHEPQRWERPKQRNFKAVLAATYQAEMNRRQKRTAAKAVRIAGQNLSDRPMLKNCLSWAGPEPELRCAGVLYKGVGMRE